MRQLARQRTPTLTSRKSQAFEGLAGEPVFRPLILGQSAKLRVELDRWFVPTEHSPLQPGTAAFGRNSCNLFQQRQPNPLAAQMRLHVQVFQIETWQ